MSMLLQAHKERIGRQIRKARQQANLSHDALGAKVGTSRQHLIKLEKGMHLPSDGLLGRIAEATGKSPSFFEGSDDDDAEADPVADLMVAIRRLVRAEVERERVA